MLDLEACEGSACFDDDQPSRSWAHNLTRRLVLAYPFVDDLAQQAVVGPGQVLDLDGELEPEALAWALGGVQPLGDDALEPKRHKHVDEMPALDRSGGRCSGSRRPSARGARPGAPFGPPTAAASDPAHRGGAGADALSSRHGPSDRLRRAAPQLVVCPRSCPSRLHFGARHRAAARRADDRGGAFHRTVVLRRQPLRKRERQCPCSCLLFEIEAHPPLHQPAGGGGGRTAVGVRPVATSSPGGQGPAFKLELINVGLFALCGVRRTYHLRSIMAINSSGKSAHSANTLIR